MSLVEIYNKYNTVEKVKEVLVKYKVDYDEAYFGENSSGKDMKNKNPFGILLVYLDDDQLKEISNQYIYDIMSDAEFGDINEIRTFLRKLYKVIEEENIDEIREMQSVIYRSFDEATIEGMYNVFKFGVAKYHPWSFLELNPRILLPAIARHMYKHSYLSKVDEESGEYHINHILCNLKMIERILNV